MKEAAAIAFNAYNAQAGGKTWDGKDIPPWEEITEAVQINWLAAAQAIFDHIDRSNEFNEERDMISQALQYEKQQPAKTNRLVLIGKMARKLGIRK